MEILEKIKTTKEFKLLPEFAYYLRCQDDENDTYTHKFLQDIKPPFLFDIIVTNKWSKQNRNMTAKNGPFSMTVGKNQNVFQYKDTD